MKSFYFISGLPRSGSTLLSSILKQNKNFYADISSLLNTLVETLIENISYSQHNYIIDEENRKNIIRSIFDGYYNHINNPIVFDTSRNWTRNTTLLKQVFPYTKILCCVRDISSIVNSFEIIGKKNQLYRPIALFNDKSFYSNNIFERCDALIHDDGLIGSAWNSLLEGYLRSPEIIYFVEYENLCKNPKKELKLIYEFLEQPYYEHNFENVEYSNKKFDTTCNLNDLHTVRKKVEYIESKKVIPINLWDKYKNLNMEFWRKENNFKFI